MAACYARAFKKMASPRNFCSVARRPAAVARKWGVVPVEMRSGRLLVAGPELPTDEMTDELERYCQAEVRFQLVTPTDFRRLAQGYLA